MAATAEPPALAGTARPGRAPAGTVRLEPAAGVELLGHVHGCGYRDGACLVRRADGQIVQLGTLLFALLECLDGRRGPDELAQALSEKLGRTVEPPHVIRLAQKLAQQGLLVGTEHLAPAKRNPLLAMRFKVLVTNQKWTKRLTAPFAFLFRPWIMLPTVLAFAVAFWFVLIHKGVASATAQAFHKPGLLLLVFALAVASAGVHELGHAAACKYGGATPGGMGMGLYLVWPAFYTDVTDTYRLPKRARLRVDLAGLYFNALISVLTMIAWLILRVDALLLLVALQILQMVKQLSPVIRADGYHILSDLTGVPDLFSHIGPTVKRLLPAHRREPSALSGRARLIVTVWVLIVVPVLLAMMIGAILVLPHIATTAWDSGRRIAIGIPREARHGQILDLLASVLQLFALVLPVIGSALITQKVVRMVVSKARNWSANSLLRRAAALAAGAMLIAAVAWAWWPAGQYNPVRASQKGTLATLASAVASPVATAHPAEYALTPAIEPGRYLAVSMTPVGGATEKHPAFFVLINRHTHKSIAILGGSKGHKGSAAVAFPFKFSGSSAAAGGGAAVVGSGATSSTGAPATVDQAATGPSRAGASSTTGAGTSVTTTDNVTGGSAHDNTATAVGTQDHGVTYDVGYSLVTVTGGQQVNETNSAVAKADCNACTTVAVAFQVVLVVGQSNVIDPINTASSLNVNCPSCSTTAYADQIVVTLKRQPSKHLLMELDAALSRLGELSALGANGNPAAVASYVAAVQSTIDSELVSSGLLANAPSQSGTSNAAGTGTSTTGGSHSSTGVNGSHSSAGTGGSSSGPGSSTTANGSSGSSTGSGGSAGSQSSSGSSSSGSTSSSTTSPTSTTSTSSGATGATGTRSGSATTTTSTSSSATSTTRTGTSTQPSGGGTSTQPPADTTTTSGGTTTGTGTSASQQTPTGTTTTGSSTP